VSREPVQPIRGSISFAAAGSNDADIHVLDAYVNWDIGSGWSVTGGRFLSWLGYESFFSVNNPEITGANSLAPGYEEGLRFTYTEKEWNAGFGVVDSVFTSPSPFQGDGEWKTTYALEAYVSYGGIKDLTVWFGLGYEPQPGAAKAKAAFDLWVHYQLSKELSVAGEFTVEDNAFGPTADSETWLILANYAFDDKVSLAARVSGDTNNGPTVDDVKWTLAPTYTVSKNFSVRAEVSYLVNPGKANPDTTSIGVQGVFRF